jgi:hypothetical protein
LAKDKRKEPAKIDHKKKIANRSLSSSKGTEDENEDIVNDIGEEPTYTKIRLLNYIDYGRVNTEN